MADEPTLGVEAQLAVLRTKMDQLLELNKSRGEDHENRLRRIEDQRPDFITKRAAYTVMTLVCMISAAITNALAFWLK